MEPTATALQTAYETFVARQSRQSHPSGRFDSKGRWYPSDSEEQACCAGVRSPSRSYPYSYMTHCRTAEHIARLHGVDVAELKRLIRRNRPARREGGETYYKLVARTDDGRLLSIFDGQTEYRIGETLTEAAHQRHSGGYYVYADRVSALAAQMPANAALVDAPRVLIRVRAEGQYCRYDNGKLAFSSITPLEVLRDQPLGDLRLSSL